MTNADGAPASPSQTAALASALDELAALGTDQDREQLAALRDRLSAARLRVLIAGEAKRGKSTLINALLGRAVLPAGVTPLTAIATTVRYGGDPRAQVPDLVARQIGRARGDLQYRLAEATRALASSVQRRYAEATDRMRAALAAAEELRGVSAAAAGEKERDLSEREVATVRALALLDEAVGADG